MALAVAAIGVPASLALASWSPSSPRASLPVSTKPDTTLYASPIGSVPPPVRPPSRQALTNQAMQAAARDLGNTIVCYKPDGSTAAIAILDRANPNAPVTWKQKESVCAMDSRISGIPGEHP
jgi:hypothetical protein